MWCQTGGIAVNNNKILGATVWILGLSLGLLFLFFVPKEQTGTVKAIIICTVVVYLLHLALWTLLQRKKLNFHNLPALTLSVFFLLVQTVWAVVVAFMATTISTKTGLFINVLLVIIQVLGIMLALISKNHIKGMSNRQKDHHVEL
jgi:dolichyl-phosphate-mannose--protein O-mannosyl transferase